MAKADYVLALKGNQETLHQAVIDHIERKARRRLWRTAHEHVTTEKGHGREETRTYLQLPAPKDLPGFTLWKGLKSIGIVTSQCVRNGKETIEVRYYISSLAVDVKQFAKAVRSHWGIENTLPLGSRYDVSRGRVADPRTGAAGKFCVAQSLHLITPEAASRPREPRHETSQLWLERKVPAGSPCWSNGLVVLALGGGT